MNEVPAPSASQSVPSRRVLPTWAAALVWPLGLAFGIGVAACNFISGLGDNSLFVDEVYSWRAANSDLGSLLHHVKIDEIAPPTYYLLLHGWIHVVGSDSEAAMRALSVIAAIGTVVAVAWTANLVAGRTVAVLAALLTGISPLMLEYGQEVRAYGLAMFALTVAVGSVLQSELSESRRRWLVLGCLAAIAAVWFHYTAMLVVIPLCAFVMWTKWISVRERRSFLAAIAVGLVLVSPFSIAQYRQGHQNAVAPIAQLTSDNAKRVIGAPFDRTYNVVSAGNTTAGALLIVIAVAMLLIPRARSRLRHPHLIAALAAFAPLMLLLITAVHQQVLISRYDAVAVPFMAIALAAGVVAVRAVGVIVVALALLIAIGASIDAHKPRNHYPDTRGAMEPVAKAWRPGDVLFPVKGYPALGNNLEYYAAHLLPEGADVRYNPGSQDVAQALKNAPGVAFVGEPIAALETVKKGFDVSGLRVDSASEVGGTILMQSIIGHRKRSR